MRVAVFGATGIVGALVVQALLDRGHEAVSVSRSAPDKQYQGKYAAHTGDMTDPGFMQSRGSRLRWTDLLHRAKIEIAKQSVFQKSFTR